MSKINKLSHALTVKALIGPDGNIEEISDYLYNGLKDMGRKTYSFSRCVKSIEAYSGNKILFDDGDLEEVKKIFSEMPRLSWAAGCEILRFLEQPSCFIGIVIM